MSAISSSYTLADLPVPVIRCIFDHLTLEILKPFIQTCRRFREIYNKHPESILIASFPGNLLDAGFRRHYPLRYNDTLCRLHTFDRIDHSKIYPIGGSFEQYFKGLELLLWGCGLLYLYHVNDRTTEYLFRELVQNLPPEKELILLNNIWALVITFSQTYLYDLPLSHMDDAISRSISPECLKTFDLDVLLCMSLLETGQGLNFEDDEYNLSIYWTHIRWHLRRKMAKQGLSGPADSILGNVIHEVFLEIDTSDLSLEWPALWISYKNSTRRWFFEVGVPWLHLDSCNLETNLRAGNSSRTGILRQKVRQSMKMTFKEIKRKIIDNPLVDQLEIPH